MNRFGGLGEGGRDGVISTLARSCRSRLTSSSIGLNTTLLCGHTGLLGARQSRPAVHETSSSAHESSFVPKKHTFGASESTFAAHESTFGANESSFAAYESTIAAKESIFGAYESTFVPNEDTFATNEYSFVAHESTFVSNECSFVANESFCASEGPFDAVEGHSPRRAAQSSRGLDEARSRTVLRACVALFVHSLKVRSRVPTSRSHAKSPPPGMRSTVFR